jgi:hypothetical protein
LEISSKPHITTSNNIKIKNQEFRQREPIRNNEFYLVSSSLIPNPGHGSRVKKSTGSRIRNIAPNSKVTRKSVYFN